MHRFHLQRGMTLIETIIGVALFVMISSSIYFSYSNILDIIIASQLSASGLTVIDNELEVIRTLPYENVGTVGGVPAGVLAPEKNVVFNGLTFVVATTVRNVDDAFDGTIGGSPGDTAAADYKLVEIDVSCPTCQRFFPVKITTTVAPVALENSSNRGALFVNVINASGQPIGQATVNVTNNQVSPTINVTDITTVGGQLQLVDTATSSLGYRVSVSKSGYSSERTYTSAELGGATPAKPYATVAQQQVTSMTFTIDQLSALNITTQDYFCSPVPAIDFSLSGSKLIGTNPNVLKYNQAHATDANGQRSLSQIEWDTYSVAHTDTTHDVAGSNTSFPLVIQPGMTVPIVWNVEAKNPSSFLVSVYDQAGQPLNDAAVTMSRLGFSETATSGYRWMAHTDWSGGFSQKSGGAVVNSPAGQIHILDAGSGYASQSDEWLESQTIDMGTNAIQLGSLVFSPESQPNQTSLRLQLATNNDNATWNYVGPDGTPATFYTVSGSAIPAAHDGHRFVRYKVWLRTDDEAVTPTLDDVRFSFQSLCVMTGSTFFTGLAQNNYTLTIQRTGYQPLSVPITINANWQEYRATLNP